MHMLGGRDDFGACAGQSLQLVSNWIS